MIDPTIAVSQVEMSKNSSSGSASNRLVRLAVIAAMRAEVSANLSEIPLEPPHRRLLELRRPEELFLFRGHPAPSVRDDLSLTRFDEVMGVARCHGGGKLRRALSDNR